MLCEYDLECIQDLECVQTKLGTNQVNDATYSIGKKWVYFLGDGGDTVVTQISGRKGVSTVSWLIYIHGSGLASHCGDEYVSHLGSAYMCVGGGGWIRTYLCPM